MSNVITAVFSDKNVATTEGLYQWDKGIILEIVGVNLPEPFEIHFANQQKFLISIIVSGQDNKAAIPDKLLTTGENVYAFVYLHATDVDGETEYRVNIPVTRRPEPSSF